MILKTMKGAVRRIRPKASEMEKSHIIKPQSERAKCPKIQWDQDLCEIDFIASVFAASGRLWDFTVIEGAGADPVTAR